MNQTKYIFAALALLLFINHTMYAQQKRDKDMQTILDLDSAFWLHYNTCNVDAMRSFFTDDLEFYHDKGGSSKGLDQFMSIIKQNLCSNENSRLRRDAVAGSVKVFPMRNGENLYGAILSGEHIFYIIASGQEPRADGLAKFTHLFLKTEDGWKISRVLSYDHGPVSYVNTRKEIMLSEKSFKQYAGNYQSPKSGTWSVKLEQRSLLVVVGQKTFTLRPETETLFFTTDRDVTFEFTNSKITVRERGKIVDEAEKVK